MAIKDDEEHGFFMTSRTVSLSALGISMSTVLGDIQDSLPLCMGMETFRVRFGLSVKNKKTKYNTCSFRDPRQSVCLSALAVGKTLSLVPHRYWQVLEARIRSQEKAMYVQRQVKTRKTPAGRIVTFSVQGLGCLFFFCALFLIFGHNCWTISWNIS